MSYHITHRPKTLSEVIGQPQAVKQLQGFLDAKSVPKVIGFFGPPGTGKTTLARIMAKAVGANDMGITEHNLAVKNGIDDIRALQDAAAMRPLGGGNAAYILDEAHSLSKQAFQGLLKLFEDTPKHSYFFLCTSQPDKIDKAIRTRITGIELKAVPSSDLYNLLVKVAGDEGIEVRQDDFRAIAKAAGGSARNALVYLNQMQACGFDSSILADLGRSVDEKHNAFPLCSMLMWPKPNQWITVWSLIEALDDDELESVRWMLLRYAASCMKDSKNAARSALLIQGMATPFFDSKKPGFLAKCYIVWSKT